MGIHTESTSLRFVASLFVLFLLSAAPALAQKGTIAGTVVDSETGETLIGANVVIKGTSTGSTTDLDGKYLITSVTPGTYSLVFSYIGYDTKSVQNVRIEPGKTVTIDLTLSPQTMGLDEVVVEAQSVQNTDAALLKIQSKAPAIMDGISSQQIKRSPDSNSGEAIRRVTGVSLVGGRYVYVRGIPERYNATLLNGTSLASSEPDRRAFAFDLLPSNLLDNIVVTKSATPNLPGDFSGGLVMLNTIDFPETFTASASVSTSYATNATFKSFMSSPEGSSNFFGLVESSRKLPASFPDRNLGATRIPNDSLQQFARMLPNNWFSRPQDAPTNTSFSLSAGNSFNLKGGSRIGLVAAVTYRNSYNTTGLVRKEFEASGDPRFDYAGNQYAYNVSWGGLFNLSFKPSKNHSISLKNLYTRSADDELSLLQGFQYADAGAERSQTAMRFVARDMYSGQLIGEHFFPALTPKGVRLRWEGFASYTTRNEPDYKRVAYERSIGSDETMHLVLGPIVSIRDGGRFYSDMNEGTWGIGANVNIPIKESKITLGSNYEDKNRDFNSRLIGVITTSKTDFDLLYEPLSTVFSPENFGTNGFSISELNTGGNNYDAGQSIMAGYAMIDTPIAFLTPKLRVVGGVRVEQAEQRMESTSFQGPIDFTHSKLDLLPSANLTYAVGPQMNVRLAYSRNVNRPELRELAPFAYFDYELQTTIYGNENLTRALIDNFDLRVETFPGIGQLVSASLFYKHFQDAIERVIVPGVSLGAERTFSNADFARSYGFELESRVNLAMLGAYFQQSGIQANYTWIRSSVDVEGSSTVLARKDRPLQGQSPYVINAGISFVEPRLNTSVSLLYNRIGGRIIEVSTTFEADVIEEPRDVFDLVVTQPLMGNFELRFAARDILKQEQRFTQDGSLVRSNTRGAQYSLGISARM